MAIGASAQRGKSKAVRSNTWSIGVGGGARVNFMKITHMAANLDADPDVRFGGVFSAFVRREFVDGIVAVRPQVSYASRGGNYFLFKYKEDVISSNYDVRTKYIDLRMPLILNLVGRRSRSSIVPYVYVSPIFGEVLGGEISLEGFDSYRSMGFPVSEDRKLNITKANMAERYFAVGAGVGAKYKFEINRNEFYLGFEALYDFGFTNTYGKTERDGKGTDVGFVVDYENTPLKGKRSFSGVEMQVIFGMPLDFNIHRKQKPRTTRSVRNL